MFINVVESGSAESGRMYLISSSKHSDPFESGNTDSFIVYGKPVRDIANIMIGWDNSAKTNTDAWYLDNVYITLPNQQQYVFF